MTFLASVLATLLEWLITKLAGWGILEIENVIAKIKTAEQAQADATKLANAKTQDEKKAAVSNVINDTFPNS